MTRKETINRNIGLTFDLIRQAVHEPALLNKIADGSVIEYAEKDFIKKIKAGKSKAGRKKKYLLVQSRLHVL